MIMKSLLAVAVAVTGATALAAAGSDDQASASNSDRKICTRIQRRGGSRLAYQRVCLTSAEWRERLGPDWRIQLTGRNPEEDVEAADFRSREQATTTYQGGLGPQ
jgi:hypothetical protein